MAGMHKWYKVPELEGAIGITEIHHYKATPTGPALATAYRRKRAWYGFAASDCDKESKCTSEDAAKVAAVLMM